METMKMYHICCQFIVNWSWEVSLQLWCYIYRLTSTIQDLLLVEKLVLLLTKMEIILRWGYMSFLDATIICSGLCLRSLQNIAFVLLHSFLDMNSWNIYKRNMISISRLGQIIISWSRIMYILLLTKVEILVVSWPHLILNISFCWRMALDFYMDYFSTELDFHRAWFSILHWSTFAWHQSFFDNKSAICEEILQNYCDDFIKFSCCLEFGLI